MHEVCNALEASGIPYMVVGSIASGAYGDFRNTHDVDIVIAPDVEQLESFLERLGQRCYLNVESARAALLSGQMFNAIDHVTGMKADLIPRKGYRYEEEAFERRRVVQLAGGRMCLAAPEDVILGKLDWARESKSQQQLQDARGVLVAQWDELDMEYLRRNASHLDVRLELERILDEAKKLRAKRDQQP